MNIENLDNRFRTKEQVLKWLSINNIKKYQIDDDLSVTIEGSIILSSNDGDYIPIVIKKAQGRLVLIRCNYKTLINSPHTVEEGIFLLKCNNLESLEGCPANIEDSSIFIESCPNFSSLQGIPGYLHHLVLTGLPKLSNLEHISRIIDKLQIETINDEWIISFSYIHKMIDSLEEFKFDYEHKKINNKLKIKDGVLGFTLIEGLQTFHTNNEILQVIHQYMNLPNKKLAPYQAAKALVVAGFSEHAKL